MSYTVEDVSYRKGLTEYRIDFGGELSTIDQNLRLTNWKYLDFQQWCKSWDVRYAIYLVANRDMVLVTFSPGRVHDEFRWRWLRIDKIKLVCTIDYNAEFGTL